MRDAAGQPVYAGPVVIDGRGDGHAVLMIRTDRGDFVLDNKRNAILPWSQTGYVYVAYLLLPLVGYLLYRTQIGLVIRAAGESPDAAQAAGVTMYFTGERHFFH